MNEWHDAGSLADLTRDGRLIARIAGREIGVLLLPGGGVRAVRNRCPHHGAPLCVGTVRRREQADLPELYRDPGPVVLRCPWHGWEFRVDDGSCPEDSRMRVATYDARVDGDRVLVSA